MLIQLEFGKFTAKGAGPTKETARRCKLWRTRGRVNAEQVRAGRRALSALTAGTLLHERRS
ncbi:hypothetical protein C882_1142 [Caenispirillum salinarum AK4]|uniref:Uncharacterized protein n=1 Tax=Caenispirillum salinarum AK4 TaxID=1238182 RepID=K9HHS8_9PROT|nr:hypothetical protein C882_1142 [Caenispirillum salinarum AK4]